MALQTFQASTRWLGEGTFVESSARGFKVHMDEPHELGGTNKAMNPVEMLLAALGGCMAIVAQTFAESCGVELRDVFVDLEGDLDPDGFLGTNPNVRPGYQQIRATVTIESPSPDAHVRKLMDIIAERCPIKDTLCGVDVQTNFVHETP